MTSIPSLVLNRIESRLKVISKGFVPASGGCINNGGELVTTRGSFFTKWNSASRYPKMLEAEASGLKVLRSAKCIHVPDVLYVDEVDDTQFIVMEFIRRSGRKGNYWTILGERLASLHKNSNDAFGLDHDNYIGSLPQRNAAKKNWIDFFVEQRLEVQISLANRNSGIDNSLRKNFELLFKKLPDLLPNEIPALLHGDLWSGNLMVNELGEPALIDPAVYFGCREAELAFTTLFSGFENEFYNTYDNVFPLQPGFKNRIDIYNLYPLLVHANLFGGGYINQVNRIVKSLI